MAFMFEKLEIYQYAIIIADANAATHTRCPHRKPAIVAYGSFSMKIWLSIRCWRTVQSELIGMRFWYWVCFERETIELRTCRKGDNRL